MRRLAVLLAAWTIVAATAGAADAGCAKIGGSIKIGDCSPDPQGSRNQPSSPSGAESSQEPEGSQAANADRARHFVQQINGERLRRDLGLLEPDERLASVARRHARRMAASGEIFHNDRMFSRSGRRALGWPRALGENVGTGRRVTRLHQAFMQSRSHRANILGSYFRQVGVGVASVGERLFVVEVFANMRTPAVPPRSSTGHRPAAAVTASGGSGRPVLRALREAVAEDAIPPVVGGEIGLSGPGRSDVPVAAIVVVMAMVLAIARPGLRRRPATLDP